MKRDLSIFMLAWALVLSVQAIAQQQNDGAALATVAPPSAFLPSLGHTLSYRFSDTLITVEAIYTEIENSLRNQYSIGYTPPRAAAGGKYHNIKLTTNDRHLFVDARDGYYAK